MVRVSLGMSRLWYESVMVRDCRVASVRVGSNASWLTSFCIKYSRGRAHTVKVLVVDCSIRFLRENQRFSTWRWPGTISTEVEIMPIIL